MANAVGLDANPGRLRGYGNPLLELRNGNNATYWNSGAIDANTGSRQHGPPLGKAHMPEANIQSAPGAQHDGEYQPGSQHGRGGNARADATTSGRTEAAARICRDLRSRANAGAAARAERDTGAGGRAERGRRPSDIASGAHWDWAHVEPFGEC